MKRAVVALSAIVMLSTTMLASAPASADTAEQLRDKYKSLTAALISYNAQRSTVQLSTYLAGARAMGADPRLTPQLAHATPESLMAQLSAAGLTIDTSTLSDPATAAAALSANTPDAAVTSAGARWFSALADIHAPEVTMPAYPDMPSSRSQVQAGSLGAGLLLTKSMTALVSDFPDQFAAAKAAGRSTPALDKAWAKSLASAWSSSGGDLSSLMPNSCMGALLQVMATGSRSSAKGCSTGCATAGLYLHNQAMRALDPSSGSAIPNPSAPVWSSATGSSMPGWMRNVVTSQNPSLSSKNLTSAIGAGAAGCRTASAATAGTVANQLPGAFAKLTLTP